MMKSELIQKIQNDFDRIALLEEKTWNHNSRYHSYLLKQLPQHSQYICKYTRTRLQFFIK